VKLRPTIQASNSKVELFLSCRWAYHARYHRKLVELPATPLGLGRAVHRGAEVVVSEHVAAEKDGPLSAERALEVYTQAWLAEGLSDPSSYLEGRAMIEGLVADEGRLDHRQVVAVERPFQIPVGRHWLRGIFDRVQVVVGPDGLTLVIIDYKSNRRLYTAQELGEHLQMSLYSAAARILWPWAKRIVLVLWMLRHRVRQETTRTVEEERAALALVEGTCEAIIDETEFAPRLSARCTYCGYRAQCPAYAEVLAGTVTPQRIDTADVTEVSREREQLVAIERIVEKRRKELDGILMTHLEHAPEILTPDVRYRLYNSESFDYPFDATVDELALQTGSPRDAIAARIGTVDKKALSKVMKQIGRSHGAAHADMVEANLQAQAKVSISPRLWATPLSR
jgi:putative RecB family exonuclease